MPRRIIRKILSRFAYIHEKKFAKKLAMLGYSKKEYPDADYFILEYKKSNT